MRALVAIALGGMWTPATVTAGDDPLPPGWTRTFGPGPGTDGAVIAFAAFDDGLATSDHVGCLLLQSVPIPRGLLGGIPNPVVSPGIDW